MAWAILPRNIQKKAKIGMSTPGPILLLGASTFQQVADRLLFGLRRIAREVGDGNALCVSHSCTIKAGLCAMMGRPMSDVKVVGHGDNTSVSLIHVDREGNFSVEYME